MPTAPPIACKCGGRRTGGVCDRCGPRKRGLENRGNSTGRGYDSQWQKFRKQYLAYNPLCVDCMDVGMVSAARDIHHKCKLRDAPELKYEEGNLMALCKMHHDKRTARGE
jgi:5-methylcytosine-specific restriction protein A